MGEAAVTFIGAFEEALAAEARRRSADGIVCGHIHHAADRTFDGVHCVNCGDWVESRTAVGETLDGCLRIVRWSDRLPGDAEVFVPVETPADEADEGRGALAGPAS